MEVAPGATIGGRYRAERRLGAGGVGEVWAGVALADGSKVAIKVLLPAAAAHRELVTRFKREAKFLARIRSQYVARVIDFLSDEAHGLVLVMELVEGEPLNELLRRVPLGVEDAIDVAWDVLGGVADLHREQIIHRDLKPGNIIVQTLGNGKKHAVIVDFGMSRMAGLDKDGEEITALTRADIAVGTMEYMAPEQILNSRGVTGSADIYAVGAILYRAVAGRHIFGDLVDAELARHKMIVDPPALSIGRSDALGLGFERIVMRMIQRKPTDRYARAEDVLADLGELRSGSTQTDGKTVARAQDSSHPSHPSQPSQPALPSPAPVAHDSAPASAPGSGRLLAAAAALGFVASAATAGVWWWIQRRPLDEAPGVDAVGASEPVAPAPASVALPPPPAPSASATAAGSAEPARPDAGLERVVASGSPPRVAAAKPPAAPQPLPASSRASALAPAAHSAPAPSPKPLPIEDGEN